MAQSQPARRHKKTFLDEDAELELDALIRSPALGKGVGSYLLETLNRNQRDTPKEQSRSGSDSEGIVLLEGTVPPEPISFPDKTLVKLPTKLDRLDSITGTSQHALSGTVPNKSTVPSKLSVPIQNSFFPARPTVLSTPAGKIRKANFASAGHSIFEDKILQTLWSSAADPNEHSRVITIGYQKLAKKTGTHKNTIIRNLLSLEKKLAIETIGSEDSHTRTGRTYRVYGFSEIQKRREKKGLLWFLKSRAGVQLMTEEEASCLSGTVPIESTVPTEGTGISGSTVPPQSTETLPSEGTETVPTEGTLLKNNKKSLITTTTAAEIKQLHQELRQWDNYVDADAARQLWNRCRAKAPTCTVEDVATACHSLSQKVTKVTNPTGLFLSVVPGRIESIVAEREYEVTKDAEPSRRSREELLELLQQDDLTPDLRRHLEEELAKERLTANDPNSR